MSPSITVAELQSLQRSQAQLVDVRSGSEFTAGHIPGAMNIPMDQIESRLADLRPDTPVVLICQAGKRARMTASMLEPCEREIAVLEGGTNAWIHAGLPVVRSAKTRWSLERQVRLAAGLLALTGAVLALTVSGRWIFLSAFVGLGLTFAGLTDLCPMAVLLAKMPWNGQSHCKLGIPGPDSEGRARERAHRVA